MSDGYAGDISPTEAWKLLGEDGGAALIDVRTNAEWSYVGLPDLGSLDKQVTKIAWQLFPDMRVNPDFLQAVMANENDDRRVQPALADEADELGHFAHRSTLAPIDNNAANGRIGADHQLRIIGFARFDHAKADLLDL